MEIEPAELPDLNVCYQMSKSYHTDYVWQMQSSETEHTVNVQFDIVRLPRSMQVEYPRNPDELLEHWHQEQCFFVARTITGEFIGFVDALSRPWENLVWIFNLVVHQRHRRQGIGTALLKTVTKWTTTHHDHARLMLEMQTKNYPAIRFAQKNGFQYCGYNERYYANGDIALFFSRNL